MMATMNDNGENGRSLPDGWEWTTVNEVADFIRGVTYKKGDASETPKKGFLPILRATNIQDNKLIEIKANKQPIGKTDLVQPFTTHDIEYKEDTTFFLFTDGLADQFGGPKGKKFKYKQFQELLLSINDKTMKEQFLLIDKEFENWRKDLEQVDDVCVIGIKI